ncbi:MAG: hypothetical protein Ct9H300mP13_7960 [Gammaproteobacteria bacterium]|nr:MAG: hypothetical protein Ct9H300mP13_7960 [Gammaproteobacteria bacterium]
MGLHTGKRRFLHMLRDESEKHGIVFIFDEVMTSRFSPGGLQNWLHQTDLVSSVNTLGRCNLWGIWGSTELMARLDPRQPDALSFGHL